MTVELERNVPTLALSELLELTYRSGKFNSRMHRDEVELNGFHISSKAGKFTATKKLQELLEDRGLVYQLNPFNFYFEIINKRLFIKYQYLIGSRLICNLSE